MLLPFLRQENMCFFSKTTHVHIRLIPRNVLFVVYKNCPVHHDPPDLSPIEHLWDMMQRELSLSPEPATTIAELRQRVQDAWDNLSQDDIRHLYEYLHARLHAFVATRGGYTAYLCDCLDTPYCEMYISVGLNLLSLGSGFLWHVIFFIKLYFEFWVSK